MSNQKPPPTVVQQPRYPTQSTYLQRPPTPRADAAFHVTQPYAPPPPNQTGNQGPALRGMAPTGPPNQSSTPPNSDLKVQHSLPQPVNLAFVPQAVRGNSQNFFGRPPPQNQPPRMPNHRIQGQQQVFPSQSAPFIQPMTQVQPIYCMSYYGNASQRQTILPQYFPGQPFTTISYPQTQQQTQAYINYPQFLPRGAQPQVVASPPQNLPQVPPPPIPIAPTSQQQLGHQKKRRAKAIPIIDPESGKDKLDEIYVCDDSHPPSGESSARQTPQPQYIPNKEVQNTFNKQVNMVINQEKMDEVEHPLSPSLDHHIESVYQTLPPTPQAVHIPSRIDALIHSSKLQLPTKEFVPAATHSNAAKEMTPVVSANVVTAEVTISKQSRESPAKIRKPREPQVVKEIKEPLPIIEKKEEFKVIKEEPKVKEPTSPPVPSMIVSSKEIKEANNQREEKKSQKKEKVEQPRPPLTPSPEMIPENVSQLNASLLLTQENGKSKQRNKDVPKQTQAPPQTTPANPKQNAASIPIPQTQPAKANNKTNKMKEINLKGANKEGTDMDAFSDNNTQPIDTVVVTNTNATTNDTININEINVNDSNKRVESNEIPIIKPETKTLPKRIDITDIVKDVPKPFVAPVETCDETDRIEYDNDKLVQVKNEANSKGTAENDTNMERRPSLPYKDDQWSPSNTSGKKVYDRDFLLALRNDPKSKKKPDNLLDIIAQEDRGRVGDINRYPMGGKPTDFTPNFSGSNYGGRSLSNQQKSTLPKRNSQQGKSGGNTKGSKSSNVIRSISVRGDVKLNESENAWKPARFTADNMSDDDKKTQELYKKVRGVLNKLTPQKFETLLVQVRNLGIDTKERLQGVIDLVFEKAVDEPNFSVAYALMCSELALLQVPSSTKKEADFVNFRKLLVTRCQLEFEKNSVDEVARNGKLKDIEECTDPERKKELQTLLDEDDRRIRRKSVGYIRFIGELFKQNMLTVNIMMKCLHHLLENKEEESLECLCKLLSTVGKVIESDRKMDLATIFVIIREIVDKKHGRISSRVRFMLQDVIDLRNSKWIPRRQDLNPKTIDQIQKEANEEQLTIQAMNAGPMTPRKDERTTSGSSGKRGTRNTSDQEGWSTASSRGRTQFSVQSDKLKNKPPQIDEPLGSSEMFGTWTRGSNVKTNAPPPVATNMFAPLENMGNDVDKRSLMNYSSKDPYHSKGTSLERNYKPTFEDGRGSRSGSQHRPHNNSQRSKPMPASQQTIPKNNPPPPPKPRQPPPEQISGEQLEQLERKIKNILEEYLNDCYTVDECDDDIRTSLPPSAMAKLVSESYIYVLERSKTARLGTGNLFANLIKRSTLSIDSYCTGLEEVLGQADDLTIDIPKIWDYLAEIIAPIINENAVPLVRLQKSFDIIIKEGHTPKLLDPLFKLVIAGKGPNYLRKLWHSSGLSIIDFMESSQVTDFIELNQLEFLLGGSTTIVTENELTYEQIRIKLLEFFTDDNPLDDVFHWIEANIGDGVHEKRFVRTLATAVFENSIVKSKLKIDNLRKHYSLLIRIVDGHLEYELECLYALQALINKLEHPQGILLSICSSLYDDNVFSHDSFVKWETSDNVAEQEGKGVALKQLTSFFTQLKEADEETSSTEDA